MTIATALSALALAACVSRPTWRGDEGTAYAILNQSTLTILEIDPDVLDGQFGSAARHACAVFVFAGSSTGVPAPSPARGKGVLLVRDPSSGHWSGPAFYALRLQGASAGEHVDPRGWIITVGCEALRHLTTLTDALPARPERVEAEEGTRIKGDMIAWAWNAKHADPQSLDGVTLRPLPVIALAYYGAPASLQSIFVDHSARNDASAEILSAIERVAN